MHSNDKDIREYQNLEMIKKGENDEESEND